jgi:hypothetical protein
MSVEIKRIEDMGLVIGDLEHLHRAYWEEAGQLARFAPQYDLLRHYWERGVVRAWGAFDGDRLVGHLTCFVTQSIHTGQPVATEDTLYVLPEYRNGTGRDLIRAGIADMAAHGIKEFWATCEPRTRVGPMLERQGFSHVSNAYRLRLDAERTH